MSRLSNLLYFFVLASISGSMAEVDFARNAASFAVDLYKNCLDGRGDENVILSPLSIQTAVALAYMGAGGETAAQMKSGLKFGDADKNAVAKNFQGIVEQYGDSPMLKIANKVYVKVGYEMKPEFKKISTEQFHSEAENLNFAENTKSAKTINSWVEDKTNNKIKDLIKPDMLNSDTRMVLVNAIYFKGFWEHKFDPQVTQKEDFWLDETNKVPVDMMSTKKHFRYGRFEQLDATALEMKYKDSDLSMMVLLPNKKTGLAELEAKLQSVNLLDLAKDMYNEEVIVKFPKFKIEFEINLNDVLTKMGMGRMFSDNAEFSDLLASPEELKVSDVVHKAFIEVNEEGAEAAAATDKRRNFVNDEDLIAKFFGKESLVELINRKTSKSEVSEPTDSNAKGGKDDDKIFPLPDPEHPDSGKGGSGGGPGKQQRDKQQRDKQQRQDQKHEPGKDKDGPGKDKDGSGKDKDGSGKDKDGQGKDKDGQGKDKDGQGKDKDGQGKDKDGQDKDGTAKQKDVPGKQGGPGKQEVPGKQGGPGKQEVPGKQGGPGKQEVPGKQGVPGKQEVPGKQGGPGKQTPGGQKDKQTPGGQKDKQTSGGQKDKHNSGGKGPSRIPDDKTGPGGQES